MWLCGLSILFYPKIVVLAKYGKLLKEMKQSNEVAFDMK
jgi:hypothetical protein